MKITKIAQDIIVTTPKSQMDVAAEEARSCIENDGGFYFRTFRNKPKNLAIGSRIFYVENGFIRGFGIVSDIQDGSMTCGTTGKDWGEGTHAIMQADSWKWIDPVPMKGFQGWRYFDASNVNVVGGWKDEKPVANKFANVTAKEWKESGTRTQEFLKEQP